MKAREFPFFLALALLGGCATTSSVNVPAGAPVRANVLVPLQAIALAADAAPVGVRGVFELQVLASGRQGAYLYLNSEADYRDQRCLTIEIAPDAVRQLEAEHGNPLPEFFQGRHIRVAGEAIRTKIFFSHNGRVTEKYYYQTHVRVTDPAQIEWVEGWARR